MASLTERNGRFLARVRRDGFATVAKSFTRKTDAAAWARAVEADMESGRWLDKAKRVPTLAEAIGQYRAVVGSRMKGANTYRYRWDELAALPLAAQPVNAVQPAAVATWRDGQLAIHKPATVVRKLAMLSAVFTWAMKERGWLTSNPVSLVSKPRANDARDRTLTPDELAALLDAASTSKAAAWLAPVVVLLTHSAMRRGEVFGLRRQDVDFNRAIAHLDDTKNGSARDVPLCPRSLDALRQLAEAAEKRGDARLLPIGSAGSVSTRFAITVRRAQRAYVNGCEASGRPRDPAFLNDVRLHDLRHHAVTAWASTGALSLLELMSISGHKTPRMLARYTHLSAEKLAGKMAKLQPSGTVTPPHDQSISGNAA